MKVVPEQVVESVVPQDVLRDRVVKTRHGPSRWLAAALVVVIVAAAVGFALMAQSTVPKADFEKAGVELASTEADLATRGAELATAQAELRVAEQEAEAAAGRADALEEKLSAVERQVSSLEGSVVQRDGELVAARAEVDRVTTDLEAEQDRGRAVISSVVGDVERLAKLAELHAAWETWWRANADLFRELDRLGADLTTMDALVASYGFAESWEDWAVHTMYLRASRQMNDILDDLDIPELEEAFDLWFSCGSDEECLLADVAVVGAIHTARAEVVARVAEALGIPDGTAF